MKCLFCGSEQPVNGEPLCTACSFYLGRGEEREYKEQLSRLASALANGDIDSDTFVKSLGYMSLMLDEMYKTSLTWDETFPENSIPNEVREMIMKPVHVMRESLDSYDEALKAYNLYAVDPDAEYLQKASMAMRKAQNLMLNSMELTKYAFKEVKNQMPSDVVLSDDLKRMDEIISQPNEKNEEMYEILNKSPLKMT